MKVWLIEGVLARRGEQQQQSPPPRSLCVTKAPLECPQDTPKEPCSGPLEWGACWLGIARTGDGRGGVEAGARRCSEQVSSEHLGVCKQQLLSPSLSFHSTPGGSWVNY